MKRLTRWWHARQRQIDCRILWPACVEQASNLEAAKTAFMMHAFSDLAWSSHYGDALWEKIDSFTATRATP
jgi:hypothetical protein